MTSPRGPALDIAFSLEESGSVLEIKGQDGDKPVVIHNRLKERDLTRLRDGLRETLERFKEKLGSVLDINTHKDKWGTLSNALFDLHSWGSFWVSELCKDERQPGALSEAQSLCRKVLRFEQDENAEPPLVQLKAPLELTLPLECLPLLNLGFPDHIADEKSLYSVARSFLGFSAIIRREMEGIGFSPNQQLDNDEKLPVKFFQNLTLQSVALERGNFSNLATHIECGEAWPREIYNERQVLDTMAEEVWSPTPNTVGDKRLEIQIHHFACHCLTVARSPLDYTLSVCPDQQKINQRSVKLSALEARLANFRSEVRPRPDDLPLIFLNACGSSKINLGEIISFPNLFLSNRNRGFIGTEAAIPDDVAAAFSERLYTNLLRQSPLGLAMYNARWELLKVYKNPLGLLYIMYADPDLKVTRKVAL